MEPQRSCWEVFLPMGKRGEKAVKEALRKNATIPGGPALQGGGTECLRSTKGEVGSSLSPCFCDAGEEEKAREGGTWLGSPYLLIEGKKERKKLVEGGRA